MKLLFASHVDAAAIEHLSRGHDVISLFNGYAGDLIEAVADRQVVVFRSGIDMNRDVLEAAGELGLLIRAGSGLDNIDIDFVRAKGIRLARIPGPGAQAVAEMAIGLLLAVSRHIAFADRSLRQGHWPKHELAGSLVHGKTLGVVGVGTIGSRVAALGRGMGMDVIGCIDPEHRALEHRLAEFGVEPVSVEETVARADFVSVHTPLTDQTRGLFDAELLATMKPGSVLINTSRGGVVDEAALYRELVRGDRIIGAALDVHEIEGEGTVSPFAELPNVVLTPHIGAMARESQSRIGKRVIAAIAAYERGDLDSEITAEEKVV